MTCRGLFLFLLIWAGPAWCQVNDLDVGTPAGNETCRVVHHTGYSVCYDVRFHDAAWVMYKLTRAEVESQKASRNDVNFVRDPDVPESGTKDDYRNSGYDKGHLAPAADMKWNVRAMRESFYLSNVTPQLHEFNAGNWEDLENDVRAWAEKFGEISVVTGPVLEKGLSTIGPDHIAVPRLFFKVVFYRNADTTEAIAFVIPNAPSNLPVQSYAVTVDSAEALTGLDFFTAVPQAIQARAESSFDTLWWFSSAPPPKHRTHKHK
jgi:endonuclease G